MLEANEFPQAFPTLPLRVSVPGIVIHILTHNHCISMGSHWCCQLNTDIAKRTTPYGGIAVLGTVKYRSDVSCMYEAVFLVFRMTAQARFFQNSCSHQRIKTGPDFQVFNLQLLVLGH